MAPFEDYQLTKAWRSLAKHWPVECVTLLSSLRLEYQLRRLGMHHTAMPSTGMIAYDWLLRKLKPDDTLAVEGFTFEGWSGHPWEIESQLILPVGLAETGMA